ncbi:MAG: GTPase Era [Desulfosarcinaceae bacterium]|nr:GTPase Era [Desulfosarcinaceae bacterium]
MNESHRSATGPNFKSGFVAILGAPNAGKSTLLNTVLGEKISITSKKPQTTRNRILGIYNREDAQIVFLDTPGVHRAKQPLNVRIVEVALSVVGDVDQVLLMADVSAPDPDAEALLLKKLAAVKKPIILALNKIDRIPKSSLLPIIQRWTERFNFAAIVPISAKHRTQVDQLLADMVKRLPTGYPFYGSEDITDLPERFIAGEMVREKAFRLTGQEIPYATAVTVDAFDEDRDGKLVRIHATLHVERDSQKGILIGKGGAKLRQIGEAARKEIQGLLGTKVFLKLFVRVEKNWSKDTKALQRFGY